MDDVLSVEKKVKTIYPVQLPVASSNSHFFSSNTTALPYIQGWRSTPSREVVGNETPKIVAAIGAHRAGIFRSLDRLLPVID